MTQWIRNSTREALYERSRRCAEAEGRPMCVYAGISPCGGRGLTIEHVVPRSHWDALKDAARVSDVAAKRLTTLTARYGGKNHPNNLVVACDSHNASRQDLKLAEFAPESAIRSITRERRAPLHPEAAAA